MAILSDKARRSWTASLIFLFMIIGLILFLTYVEIPDKNKDIVTSIIGMIIGSISTAISIFVGRDPDDIKELKDAINSLNSDRTALIERLRDAQLDKEVLRRQLDHLQAKIIERLSIFIGEEGLTTLGRPEEVKEIIDRYIPEKKEFNFSEDQLATPLPKRREENIPKPKKDPFADIMGSGDDER